CSAYPRERSLPPLAIGSEVLLVARATRRRGRGEWAFRCLREDPASIPRAGAKQILRREEHGPEEPDPGRAPCHPAQVRRGGGQERRTNQRGDPEERRPPADARAALPSRGSPAIHGS